MIERRAESRMLCADLVNVRWKDKSGRTRKSVANLEDISQSGVCLQLDTAIPIDTLLEISHSKGAFQGNVRYCLFREIGYFLGVQFSPGCKWSESHYQPQHLLDLRRLVILSARKAAKRGESEAVQSDRSRGTGSLPVQ
jgi:hypothetical protein